MEPSGLKIELGPVLQTWGPFRIHSYLLAYPDGRRITVPHDNAVTIVLDPDHERTIDNLPVSRVDLASLVAVVRENLKGLAMDVDYWRRHVEYIQSPEGLSDLQQQLDEDACKLGEVPENMLSVTQVVKNQRESRDELEHFYMEVRAGLTSLESEHPELGDETL